MLNGWQYNRAGVTERLQSGTFEGAWGSTQLQACSLGSLLKDGAMEAGTREGWAQAGCPEGNLLSPRCFLGGPHVSQASSGPTPRKLTE